MECRENCGACCIAPSITSLNKPAGTQCTYLDAAMRCRIFGLPERPQACADFAAETAVCGVSREDALIKITTLEAETAP